MPWAPGTVGSAVAALLAVALWVGLENTSWSGALGGSLSSALPWVLALAAAFFFPIGVLAIRRLNCEHDPSYIVIDEACGVWLCFALIPLDALSWLVGFALFRAFDILKPFPINRIDARMRSPLGTMVDDLVASLAAVATLWVGVLALRIL